MIKKGLKKGNPGPKMGFLIRVDKNRRDYVINEYSPIYVFPFFMLNYV